MADAKITLSLSPSEFDTIRGAIGDRINQANTNIGNHDLPAEMRAKERALQLHLNDLLSKLK